jgi:hypothetical protein
MSDRPMTENAKSGKALQADQRQARLAAQLRSNLKKRKQQARERTEAGNPATQSGDMDEVERPKGRTEEGVR